MNDERAVLHLISHPYLLPKSIRETKQKLLPLSSLHEHSRVPESIHLVLNTARTGLHRICLMAQQLSLEIFLSVGLLLLQRHGCLAQFPAAYHSRCSFLPMPVTALSRRRPRVPTVRLMRPSPELSSLMVLTMVPSGSSCSQGSTRWLGGGTCTSPHAYCTSVITLYLGKCFC